MKKRLFSLLMMNLLMFSFVLEIHAQESYYIYPPIKAKDLTHCDLDTTHIFTHLSCHFSTDENYSFYVKNELIDTSSIQGWVLIYSFWEDNSIESKNEFLGKKLIELELNKLDKGYDTFINPNEKTAIQGVYVRKRVIAILNLYTCKIYFMENLSFFQKVISMKNCNVE